MSACSDSDLYSYEQNSNAENISYIQIIETEGWMRGVKPMQSKTSYIDSTGNVQISEEDGSGVIHNLFWGHAKTSYLFSNLIYNKENIIPLARKDAIWHTVAEPPVTHICLKIVTQEEDCYTYHKSPLSGPDNYLTMPDHITNLVENIKNISQQANLQKSSKMKNGHPNFNRSEYLRVKKLYS